MSDEENQLIKNLPGVGAVTTKKLNEVGIFTSKDLILWNGHDLAEKCNISIETATSYIGKAQELLREKGLLPKQFTTAAEVLERRESLLRLTTGSKELDKLFDDGFGNVGLDTGAVVEFFGEYGSGKSQICHTLCVLGQRPIEEKGLAGGVIYLDTEGTFRPERIKQISMSRGIDHNEVLNNIMYAKVINSTSLELIIHDLTRYVKEFNAKLVIVDSIIALHREEFKGRGTLADRQQRIGGILQKLHRLAEVNNILVIITNQVTTNPGQMFGDPIIPVGGNIVGHSSTYRVYLRKSSKNRIARMKDSPGHAAIECRFTVNERGIDDVDEEK